MCRYLDQGPYSAKNCFIDLTDNNLQTRWEHSRKVLKDDHMVIASMWLETDLTQRQVAEIFSVDQSCVSKIIKKVKNEQQLSAD